MAEFLIMYIDATADERNFGVYNVLFEHSSLVDFELSFCVVSDLEGNKKFFSATRILQIDEKLTEVEQKELLQKYRYKKKATVYFHKADVEQKTLYVKKVRCVGARDRPFGFSCILAEIGEHFTKLIIPSFKEVVYIPTQKIVGIDING